MQEARGKSKFDGEKINGADHSKWNRSILQREVSCQAALALQYFRSWARSSCFLILTLFIQHLSETLLSRWFFSLPCSKISVLGPSHNQVQLIIWIIPCKFHQVVYFLYLLHGSWPRSFMVVFRPWSSTLILEMCKAESRKFTLCFRKNRNGCFECIWLRFK